MDELEKVRMMLVEGSQQVRATKRKTWPTFGLWMWLFQVIIAFNKALAAAKKEQQIKQILMLPKQ